MRATVLRKNKHRKRIVNIFFTLTILLSFLFFCLVLVLFSAQHALILKQFSVLCSFSFLDVGVGTENLFIATGSHNPAVAFHRKYKVDFWEGWDAVARMMRGKQV